MGYSPYKIAGGIDGVNRAALEGLDAGIRKAAVAVLSSKGI
jgi:hypothetical protein